MATKKKKINYISYELQKLEKYINQLQSFMDNNPPDSLEDRLDVRESANGNPIVKVVASIESQLKTFRDTLEKLPALYESLNNLRRIADSDPNEEEIVEKARGGTELPGIFKTRMLNGGDDTKEHDEIEEIKPETEEEDDLWED